MSFHILNNDIILVIMSFIQKPHYKARFLLVLSPLYAQAMHRLYTLVPGNWIPKWLDNHGNVFFDPRLSQIDDEIKRVILSTVLYSRDINLRDTANNVYCTLALIEAKADVNFAKSKWFWNSIRCHTKYWTPLMYAIKYKNEQVIQILLEAKADTNKRNIDNDTALTIAAMRGHDLCVRILLEAKVDPNQTNSHGSTPLILSAKYGHKQVLPVLLEAGGVIDAQNKMGQTGLMFACANNQEHMTRLMLEAKANPNKANAYGSTALTLSAQNGHGQILRILIEANAFVDHRNEDGWTALMIAAHNNDVHVTEILLKAGCAVDAQNNRGWTALMHSTQNNYEPLLRLLISARANPFKKSWTCASALTIASKFNNHHHLNRLMAEHYGHRKYCNH